MRRKLTFVHLLTNSYSKHLMACSMPGTVAVLRIVTLLVTTLMRPIYGAVRQEASEHISFYNSPIVAMKEMNGPVIDNSSRDPF